MKTIKFKLTPAELEALLFMVRDAANEPSDVDYAVLTSLRNKIETAAE